MRKGWLGPPGICAKSIVYHNQIAIRHVLRQVSRVVDCIANMGYCYNNVDIWEDFILFYFLFFDEQTKILINKEK